jgi:site-specific DNA-methyltransferase (adenine-specific)
MMKGSQADAAASFEQLGVEERRQAAAALREMPFTAEPVSVRLHQGDARELDWIADESIHLVVTSPPYWTLKEYNDVPGQLGHVKEYEAFLDELDRVWKHVFRILVPGGRLVCVVGDVCLARREHGRHYVMPLHADITVRCRRIGFDNLNPILWLKIANATLEVENGSKFLGKPYEPNAIVKNDVEFILMQRKPGGYRSPTEAQRKLSMIAKEDFDRWFQQTWSFTGASTRDHPAPFPIELAHRLVRMFSFVGDTVCDPFAGTGTTLVAAAQARRNAIGIEIDPSYLRLAKNRLTEVGDLFHQPRIEIVDQGSKPPSGKLNLRRGRGARR